MEKIDAELNKLLITILIFTFVFFALLFFNREIYIYFGISDYIFKVAIAFLSILFLFFAYFKIKSTSKKFRLEFDRVVSKKEKELTKTNLELQNTNESLTKQLYVDSLTNLLNRKALQRDISSMQNPKLIILDIDSFAEINEYYGHDAGDFVLKDVATVLQNCPKIKNFNLYRLGADEFALLEDSELDMDRYEDIASGLIEFFKTIEIKSKSDGDTIEINITLGFCFDEDNTLEKALIALNEAKQKQIHFLCYFKKINRENSYFEQIKWSKFISKAIKEKRVIPYYQPIFDTDKKVVKYESLVRILNENEEVVPPSLFLEIAKKVKKYSEIEKLLIEKSFQAIQGSDTVISVNLLARDMSDGDVNNFVISMLAKYNVSNQVVFEILENENIENLDRVTAFINRVRRMGCKIAIDDFGTGYSNFSYLTKLKPDYIKIDGSLIRNLESDENSYAIVSSIITFAQKLNIKTIAEFIHNEEVFEICKNLGVDEFQGFYLGEPTPRLIQR